MNPTASACLSPPLAARARAMAEAGTSAAWALAAEAATRAHAGEDIILLTLGDPEGPPHPAIVAAAREALAAGRTHYAPLPGEPALRSAVARHLGCGAELVTILPGAQHGVFAAVQLVAGPGDTVILTDPCYATYPGVVAASGAEAVLVPLSQPGFRLDHEALAAAIAPSTRAILLTSPGNPTGAMLDAADFALLARLAEAHGLWLILDETYASFAFAAPHLSALAAAPAERMILVGTLSKSHAMTGFRLGWAVAPPPVTHALETWSAAATFGVAQFVQDAGVAALAIPEAELAPWRRAFADRAAHVAARVNSIPGLATRVPQGGMFLMLDARGLDGDDVALARRLLEEANVALVPGSGFGAGAAGHLRVSLTPSLAVLDSALERLARWARD